MALQNAGLQFARARVGDRYVKEMMEAESAKVAGKGMRDQPVGLLMKTQA